MLHIPPTSEQEPHKKAHLLTKNTEEFLEKKVRRMGQQAEKKLRQKE